MFFVLSKTLYYIIMPSSLIAISLFGAFLFRKRKYGKKLLTTSLVFFFLFTNQFIINELLTLWEVPVTPISKLDKDYDVGIVLSGITNYEKKPHDRVYLTRGADRIMHAALLYKKGIIKKILISGGGITLYGLEAKESQDLKKILLLCGVKQEDIITESTSRNTYENAQNSAKILKEKHVNGKYLLFTSAFHMRRSISCFEKAGIEAIPFSTDFYSFSRRFHPDVLLIPREGAMDKWRLFIREFTGFIVYKIMGYA